MSKQLSLAFDRPRKRRRKRRTIDGRTPRPRVPHRSRPLHQARNPVHVTLRVRPGVPSLRSFELAKTIVEGLRKAATSTWKRQAQRRESFRVVTFSIQPNHLHLLVEAADKAALARGMQGLAAGMARRINRTLRRRGRLFAERYHAHALRSPREVRNGLVYVLKNFEKHPEPIPDLGTAPRDGIDPCSSARWFAGWREPCPASVLAPPVAAPRTWLLRVGWNERGGGRIRRSEAPAAGRG
jgi:REP element-mobilizing transposase RayT